MMPKLYLTIDDGPSPHFTKLIDFLDERSIRAVFFNRGDLMQARPDDVIYGIQRGQIMANHGYDHVKASALSFEAVCANIMRCEALLDDLYERAGAARTGKYFRFPYMDRGMGAALIEAVPQIHQAAIRELVTKGLGHSISVPSESEIKNKNALQEFLRDQGFDPLPTPGVSLPWYGETEMAQTIDSLCTFSTSDWVLNDRHKGRFGYHTIEDLKRRIDEDAHLHDESSNHIILAHDGDDIHEVTCALIDHLLAQNFEFLTIL